MVIRNKIAVFEILFIGILFLILFKIYNYNNKLYQVSEERVQMLLFVNRLREDSYDLTNYARSYIITKNKKFNKQYFNLLDNRDKIFSKLPFNKIELSFLIKSNKDFDKLLKLEKISFDEVFNNNQKKAINIMFSTNYYNIKASLINLIDNLIKELKNRTYLESKRLKDNVDFLLNIFLLLSLIFVMINIYLYFYLNNKNGEEIKYKNNLIKNINYLNDNLENTVTNRTEEINKLLKIKSEFLANMSHEIRTPLNAMLGFIQILEQKDLDKESKTFLKIIETSGKDLVSIINDILDFSKIEAGKFQIEKREFNPKEEIVILKELFNSKASEKNIILELNENLKYNIISDSTRIKQVIANLLSNAIKFTPNNKKIILQVNYNDELEVLKVEVIDEGIGISNDKLSHIFQAFSQADTSTTRKYGGTGLGLTISYKLIQLLGGELKVISILDKGSNFYFEIPAKKGSVIEETLKVKENIIKDFSFKGNMLVVEDNKANQMFMKVILKKMGINFEIANDGVEAVEKFKNNSYDVILMDENMPNMNGIEASKKIREYEKNSKLKPTIIIALTANAMEGDKDRFLLAGMDYYLSKPLDIVKLENILEKL